tara:strand:- start:1440 stop:1865 length:426 start_codon:yes stop_codon:yes gene_type:complete
MERNFPDDQQIVEEYFDLATNRKTKKLSWLYGMVATFGLDPDQLDGFTWNNDYSINLKNKKRAIQPLHPQWTFLFELKEKQPCKSEDCLSSVRSSLYRAMAFEKTQLRIRDLLEAYEIRKNFYKNAMQQQRQESPSLANVS